MLADGDMLADGVAAGADADSLADVTVRDGSGCVGSWTKVRVTGAGSQSAVGLTAPASSLASMKDADASCATQRLRTNDGGQGEVVRRGVWGKLRGLVVVAVAETAR